MTGEMIYKDRQITEMLPGIIQKIIKTLLWFPPATNHQVLFNRHKKLS